MTYSYDLCSVTTSSGCSNYYSSKEGGQEEWQSRHREKDAITARPPVLRQIQSVSSPAPPSYKYGHFWLQKNKRTMEEMPN